MESHPSQRARRMGHPASLRLKNESVRCPAFYSLLSATRVNVAPMKCARFVIVLLFVTSVVCPLNATTVVAIRTPMGSSIIVGADSEIVSSVGQHAKTCKIVQIAKPNSWVAMSGLVISTNYLPYVMAITAASRHPKDLSATAAEFSATVRRALSRVGNQTRKLMEQNVSRKCIPLRCFKRCSGAP